MNTIKGWLASPWFKDTAERVIRAYFGAALLVITGHLTGTVDLAVWKSILLAGVVPAVSVLFSILSTVRSGPSATPASLVAEPEPTAATATIHVDGHTATVTKRTRAGEHTVTHRIIPEHKVEGKPLGRHIRHDSRSLNFLVEPDGTTATVRWTRELGVLDQGNTGSCTGQAATGALGTAPDYAALSSSQQSALGEPFALNLYSAAEKIDGGAGLPTEDNGSSGLSVAKAAKAQGLISGYLHITSLAAAKTAIQTGPFIVGCSWRTPGMDNPSASGLVTATGTVRGGHEWEMIGYDADEDLWEAVNSWGEGWGVKGHFFMTSATFATLLADQGDATVLSPLGSAPFPAPTPTPVVATNVVVDDLSLVAHLSELAAKAGESAHDFLAARLHKLYPSAK